MPLAHPIGLGPSIGKQSLRHRAQRVSGMAQPAAASARTWQSMADARLGEHSELYPPRQPLAAWEKGSFAEGTVTKRLPAIINSTLKDMTNQPPKGADPQQLAEAAAAISDVARQQQGGALVEDLPPLPSESTDAHAALAACIHATNTALQVWRQKLGTGTAPTWLNLPWLLVECYMYVSIARAIQVQPSLAAASFDPFAAQKRAGWIKSLPAAAELAGELEKTLKAVAAAADKPWDQRGPVLRAALYSMLQCALWGNVSDLSLHVDASGIKPSSMVSASSASTSVDGTSSTSGSTDAPGSAGTHPNIIVDEVAQLWERLAPQLQEGKAQLPRVDIILDNAGLELYGDLVLADFLVEAGITSKVVLHGKAFGWFVSDVLRSDLDELMHDVQPSSPIPQSLAAALSTDQAGAKAAWAPVQRLGARWKGHLEAGRWTYTAHPFWTTPWPFCFMSKAAPDLHSDLSQSSLLIFKGDLNYRKLTSDCRWPTTTPFATSLLGFQSPPLLSLRTLKADVVVGLRPGQAELLDGRDKDWQVNGKFAMMQFRP